jgi:glycosyltransferase involved in cell wall biosynthesis
VLFVSRERHRLPLDDVQRRKWDAIAAEVEPRIVAAAPAGYPTRDERFRLVPPSRPRALDGAAFYAALPFRVARELHEWRPDAVLVQGVHEGALVLLARMLARSRARVVLDVHGDWRTATRLYGSPLRGLLSPLADALAPVAVRRADAVRTLSPTTTEQVRALGVEPAAEFPAYVDLEAFTATPPKPLPDEPRALFVGVLERYKAVDVLAEAWRRVSGSEPLTLIGEGTLRPLVEQLARDDPRVAWTPRLAPDEVARALDDATVLLLPSRSEGLPRVAIEALCRGRPIVGARAGGIPDIVEDGVNGILVEPGDAAALAAAIEGVLADRELAERLAAGARETAQRWIATPEAYAARLAALLRARPARRTGSPRDPASPSTSR